MVVATATHLELLVGESGTISSEDREGVGGEGWRGRDGPEKMGVDSVARHHTTLNDTKLLYQYTLSCTCVPIQT